MFRRFTRPFFIARMYKWCFCLDGAKLTNKEEKVKVTKERISQEKQKRIEELLEAQRQGNHVVHAYVVHAHVQR